MPGFFCQIKQCDPLDHCQKIILLRTEGRQTEKQLKDMSNLAALWKVESQSELVKYLGLLQCKRLNKTHEGFLKTTEATCLSKRAGIYMYTQTHSAGWLAQINIRRGEYNMRAGKKDEMSWRS